MPSPVLQIRLPEDVFEQVRTEAVLHRATPSAFVRDVVINHLISLAAAPLVPEEPKHQPGAAGRRVAGGSKDYVPPKRIACRCGGFKDHRDRCNRCNQTKYFQDA